MPKWRRAAGQDRFEKFESGDLPHSAYQEAARTRPRGRLAARAEPPRTEEPKGARC